MRALTQLWTLPALTLALVFAQPGIASDSTTQRNARSHLGKTLPNEVPAELQNVGITEKLGQNVSIQSLTFTDEAGRKVPLSNYFKAQKPVLLNLVYYGCASLCSYVLNGMLDSLKLFEWTPGNQFEIVTVSIDPTEGAELAAEKKASYLKSYGRAGAESGWHFLTGEESQIKRLADEVGFGYRYDEKEKQYAHGAALFILTPEGKISRYLYGISYSQQDLKLSLLEASSGKVGTIVDRLLLFCYRYNPMTRSYSLYLNRLMQGACGAMVLVLGLYLLVMWRREKRAKLESPVISRQGGLSLHVE